MARLKPCSPSMKLMVDIMIMIDTMKLKAPGIGLWRKLAPRHQGGLNHFEGLHRKLGGLKLRGGEISYFFMSMP